MGVWKNIRGVVLRELTIWRRRPIYLIGSVVTMLFCTIFCLTFFREGVPEDMPVGIVDEDQSWVSRYFCRELDAMQGAKVIKYDTYEEASADLYRGEIGGVMVLPERLNADIQSQKQPEVHYYTNALYIISGSLSYKAFLTMTNTANAAVQREVFRKLGVPEYRMLDLIQPIRIDTHQIGNAENNYGYYLSNILLPGFLEMIVILVLSYSLGSELKYGTSRHLLETTHGSMIDAILGKLFVYTILFSAIGITLILILYSWAHFPIAGSIWNMFLAIIMLVLASEGISIFIIGCLPVPRLALSISALYSVLGFSLSGFTLPAEVMPDFIQGWAEAFPLRHYYIWYCQEVFYGTGFAGWWKQLVILALFIFLPLFVLYRLKGAYVKQNFPTD
jgi:ABC-2 type transport system permease protein